MVAGGRRSTDSGRRQIRAEIRQFVLLHSLELVKRYLPPVRLPFQVEILAIRETGQ